MCFLSALYNNSEFVKAYDEDNWKGQNEPFVASLIGPKREFLSKYRMTEYRETVHGLEMLIHFVLRPCWK